MPIVVSGIITQESVCQCPVLPNVCGPQRSCPSKVAHLNFPFAMFCLPLSSGRISVMNGFDHFPVFKHKGHWWCPVLSPGWARIWVLCCQNNVPQQVAAYLTWGVSTFHSQCAAFHRTMTESQRWLAVIISKVYAWRPLSVPIAVPRLGCCQNMICQLAGAENAIGFL